MESYAFHLNWVYAYLYINLIHWAKCKLRLKGGTQSLQEIKKLWRKVVEQTLGLPVL